MELKDNADLYLLGQTCLQIITRKLPTNQQVLQLLFHKTRILKMRKTDAINDVFKEIQSFWNEAKIVVLSRRSFINKLQQLYDNYCSLKKK